MWGLVRLLVDFLCLVLPQLVFWGFLNPDRDPNLKSYAKIHVYVYAAMQTKEISFAYNQ